MTLLIQISFCVRELSTSQNKERERHRQPETGERGSTAFTPESTFPPRPFSPHTLHLTSFSVLFYSNQQRKPYCSANCIFPPQRSIHFKLYPKLLYYCFYSTPLFIAAYNSVNKCYIIYLLSPLARKVKVTFRCC